MSALKKFAVSILSLFLFLSLSVFGYLFTLNRTALNPDFIVAELGKLDVAALVKDLVGSQIPPEAAFVAPVSDSTIKELEPRLKEQADTVIYAGYDYLLGKSQDLNATLSLEPLKTKLRDDLKTAISQSPPSQLAAMTPAAREQYFNQLYQQISAEIPSTFEISKRSLPSNVAVALEQARLWINYYQMAFWGLIVFMVLLVAGIVLIIREVRGSTRSLGSTFLAYGILEYAALVVIKYVALPQLAPTGSAGYLETWVAQLLRDFIAPLEMFSLGFIAAGIVMLIVSFVYRPATSSD